MRKSIRPIFLFALAGLLTLLCSSCSPAAKTARHLAAADRYFTAGDYDKAEIEYLNVLQTDRINPSAIGRLGVIYYEQGRLSRVMPYLLKARELQPANLEVRLKLGMVYLSTGKMKEARDEAGFILDHEPGNAEATYLLAEAAAQPKDLDEIRLRLSQLPAPAAAGAPVAVAQGLLDLRQRLPKEAEAAFERALALNPKSSTANAALGALAVQKKDLPRAEKYLAAAADLAPARSPRRLQYAQFKIQNGDPAGGRRLLEEMTKKTPDYLPALLALAGIEAEAKKYSGSAALVAQVLTRDPTNPEALLLSARLKLAQNEPAKAVAELEKVVSLYPRSPQVHYQLGMAYLAAGQMDKAMASLTQAVSLAPAYPEAVLLQASLFIRRGNFSAAIVALKQLLPQRPDLIQGWLMLADAYSRQGNFADTLGVYDQVDKYFPGSPQTPLLRGLVYVQQNQRAEARQAFNRALEISPGFPMAEEQLVNLDVMEKQFPAALQRVAAMMAKDPKQAGPWLLQARVHLAQNDMAQAEAALRKAIELQPDSPAAYSMLARIFVITKQPGKALENLRDAVAKNPKDTGLLMMTGTLYDQQKNYPAAREAYEKLLTLNPNFSAALNNLSYLYSEHFNLPDKALELAQKARELLPNDPNVADTLGWILYKQRQYPRALALLLESAGKQLDAGDVQFHLGMTQYMLGQEPLARTALQRALELDKNLAGKDEAQSCLAILGIDVESTGARAILEKALSARPDDPVALVRLAAVHERAGKPDLAIKAYQSALQASPANAKATVGLAQLYFAQKDTAKALELAKTARKLAPDDPEAAQTLGRLEYRLGEYQWAASLLQEAVQRRSDDPDLLFDEALALYSVGRVTDATSALHHALNNGTDSTGSPQAGSTGSPQALRIFTHADEARRMLDLIALAANPPAAMKESARIESLLKSEPEYVPALMASGTVKEQQSEAGAARQAYEKVLGHFPDFAPAKLRVAILSAAGTGFDQKAFEWALQARTAYPNDPELAKALGILTYRKGDAASAVALLNESLTDRGSDAELWYYLGRAQLQTKDQAGGKKSLQQALALNLKADLAAEAKKTLSGLK